MQLKVPVSRGLRDGRSGFAVAHRDDGQRFGIGIEGSGAPIWLDRLAFFKKTRPR